MKTIRISVIFLLFSLSLMTASLFASIRMGTPFCDGMILQNKCDVAIWGQAAPKSTVTLIASWNYNKKVKTQADETGRWKTTISTPKGSFTPYTLTVNDGESILMIRDVLIGEVWLASGQSNMEMPLTGWKDSPLTNSQKLIAGSTAYSGKLHFINVPRACTRNVQDTIAASWQNCLPSTVGNFSAVAYHFACTLINTLKMPVGIINCCWGGSCLKAWEPGPLLEKYGMEITDSLFLHPDQCTPSGLFNGMLSPFIGYTIKGFIWYQGESEAFSRATTYAQHFSDMIKWWRKEWNIGNLPFYFVEISPYQYSHPDGLEAPLIREQQNKVAHMLDNVGMVATNDLVTAKELKQIHPANKQPVGQRLANWALDNDYKQSNVVFSHPEFKSMTFKSNRIFLQFTNTPNGFNRQDDITGFEVCGADSVFHPVKASEKSGKIMLRCDSINKPIAVRYCFKNFQLGNLARKEGLPVIPFRTDNFPLKKQ